MTDTVYTQIMAIRETGDVNMLDTVSVQRLAHDNDFFELVVFIEDNKREYVKFILYGVRE